MSAPAVAVVGAGGHAKVVLATLTAAGVPIAGVWDDDPEKAGGALLGVPIRGRISELDAADFPHGVLAIGDARVRQRLAGQLDLIWSTVVHPSAVVDPSVRLGAGTVVFAGAIVQPGVEIGAHVIVNTAASVDHDCRVADFVHLAPGTRLGGGVRVGEGSLVGIGSSVLPSVEIGAWATVGAGAAVVHDVPDRHVVVGVPARRLT